MQGFWDWFIGEAGAGWIIGILGGLWVVYTWLQRERPPKIIIQEIERIKLIDIHPSQKDNLTVIFKASDKEYNIQNLVQKTFAIYNNGTRDILEDLSITLANASSDYNFISMIIGNAVHNYNVMDDDIEIPIPYLNSYPNHHHFIKIFIISDKDIEFCIKQSTGKGWSARIITLDTIKIQRNRLRMVVVSFALILMTVATGLSSIFATTGTRPLSPLTDILPIANPVIQVTVGFFSAMLLGMYSLFTDAITYPLMGIKNPSAFK